MVSLVLGWGLMLFRSRFRWRLVLASAVCAVTILPILAGKEIGERFFSVQTHEVDASANSRKLSWLAAWRIASDYPVFGVGVRNSNLFSYQYGADQPGRTIHNQYLQVLADTGFPGLTFYLLILYATWAGMRRTRRALAAREDDEAIRIRSMLAGTECGLLIFCVGALFLSLETFELTYVLLLIANQAQICSRSLEAEPDSSSTFGSPQDDLGRGSILAGQSHPRPPVDSLPPNVV